MEIEVDLVPPEKRGSLPDDPLNISFGTLFTDHMFTMEYSGSHWHNPRIVPYHPLALDPAALVLHYGQGIFEGMKAYRRGDRVFLFRPEKNLERLNASARRLVMPEVDPQFILHAIKELVRIERDWVPQEQGTSLYIRPTMIATEARLGVKPAKEFLFYVILSPVGPYFKEGFRPVKVFVSDKYARAVRGGVGAAKTIGNYAASLLATQEANNLGYSQVLWLDALEFKYIEECGTMNVFVKFKDELATTPLDGAILPGITRDSVIQMARDWGVTITERKISIDEVIAGIKDGSVEEVFGTGTAAIIAPIGEFYYKGNAYTIGSGDVGKLTRRLYETLTGLQSGEIPDKFGWTVQVG
ncbi:MAG: branched-chain amino acid aminotransferase [Candidatus Thorarchaeota archaeon]